MCAAADVTVLRLPPSGAVYKPRTTIAVAAVRALVMAETDMDATWVLRTLADGGLAPLAASHVRALQHLIADEDFVEVDREALARAVATTPIKPAEQEAREHAAVHCVPAWRGLAAVWFKAARKAGRRAQPQAEKVSRAPVRGTIPIPSWVPDNLVEDFRDVALAEGEEAAAAHVRKLKRQGEPT